MKLIKKLFENAALIKTCGFVLQMFFAFSCSQPNEQFVVSPDEKADIALKKTVNLTEIHLEGFSQFYIYDIKESIEISDPTDPGLVCTAIFSCVKGQYQLETKEWFGPMLYRAVTYNVKMTPSGILQFEWPETWFQINDEGIYEEAEDVLGIMSIHLGYSFNGPGVNKETIIYKGYFDGENFYASMHLIGHQDKPVDGPIQIEFSFDLHEVN